MEAIAASTWYSVLLHFGAKFCGDLSAVELLFQCERRGDAEFFVNPLNAPRVEPRILGDLENLRRDLSADGLRLSKLPRLDDFVNRTVDRWTDSRIRRQIASASLQ